MKSISEYIILKAIEKKFGDKNIGMKTKAKRSFCFIVNPIAGTKNNIKYCQEIQEIIEKIKFPDIDIQFIVLGGKGQVSQITKELNNDNCTIVSVGGDGTFNEIASSLVNTNTPIAIIPRGSGNGLARMIKIPNRKKEIAEYLLQGDVIKVDAGKVNDNYFFCTCGVGFDAHIASVFNKGKQRGSKQYVQHILKLLLSYNPIQAEFTIDGVEYKGKYFLVTFSNANQYGNNAFIAPNANLSDGLLQVTILHPFPQALAPLIATALLGGFIDKIPYVETLTMHEAEIISMSSNCFHCDGESLVEMKFPIKITGINHAIQLLVPKKH